MIEKPGIFDHAVIKPAKYNQNKKPNKDIAYCYYNYAL